MQDDQTAIRDFAGGNLEISNGVLNAPVDALDVDRYLDFDNDTLTFTGRAEGENELTTSVNSASGTNAVVAGGNESQHRSHRSYSAGVERAGAR